MNPFNGRESYAAHLAVLTKRGADIESIAEAYAAETGHRPVVFSGSSPGAGAFGHLRVRRNR